MLMDSVVTAPSEHTQSLDAVTENAVEAATAATLRFTPERTKELLPAGGDPAVTVTSTESYLLPISGVTVCTFVAASLTHVNADDAEYFPEVKAALVQVRTVEKAAKKSNGQTHVDCIMCNHGGSSGERQATWAPVTPGKGLSITSEVVLVVVPVGAKIAKYEEANPAAARMNS